MFKQMEKVILVDREDNEIGLMEKMQAHKENKLHRAVSVLIFNSKGEILLQKRAEKKYHSPLLWTNAACTHPRQGEENITAAKRRLKEEMGLISNLEKAYSFIYQVDLENGLSENEFDHVYFGISDEIPNLNANEVDDFTYVSYKTLIDDLNKNPNSYTSWFKIIVKESKSLIENFIKDLKN